MNVNIAAGEAVFAVRPDYGLPVTFTVRSRVVDVAGDRWRKNLQERYVVGLKGSDGSGFAHFMSFERACASALSRARRYERAYAKPRGIAGAR